MASTPKPGLGGAVAYLLLSLPMGMVGCMPLVVLTMAGLGLSTLWVGIPVLMLVTEGWRGVARLERRWIRATLRADIPLPYRPLPAGSIFRRWRAKLADPATWRDIAYILLRVPLGVIEFGVTVVLWAPSIAMILMPVYAPLLPGEHGVSVPDLTGHIVLVRTFGAALPYAAVGIVLLLLTILVTPRLAQLQALVAHALLGPTKASRLTVKAEHLQASRARGVDAAEAERRRIERDLHDGAQQRLVSVAMALGRAKTKLESDPTALRELIDEAHGDAKLAVAELRDLARGIYPAVLGDRGLDAALSALAARCPVPVDIEVDVVPRPPAAVESTAYFIVGEALTNVAKHADEGITVVAEVGDGGALLDAVLAHRPDLAIVDVRMPPTFSDDGLRAAVTARQHVPDLPILVLSQYVEERYAVELVAGGAQGIGYLLKERVADVAEFVAAVRSVAAGGTCIDREVITQLLVRKRRNPVERLSPREREVLGLMAQGMTNAAIAGKLVVSDGSVEKHIGNIFAKLGLEPRAEEHRRVRAVLTYLEQR